MKNLITNYGRGLAATAFKNSITSFVLIGAATNNETGLTDLLDKDTSIVKDFNINDNTAPLFNYIITPLSPISTSMIDNDRRLIFKIELRPNFIPDREFVYAVALSDDYGNVYSISSFKTPFNKVDDAGEIITIKHILASDEISGNDFNILSQGDDYVTREEFVSWISNHNHDERTVSKRELSDAITIIDDKKADSVTIGNLNSVPTADKSSVEKIFVEILNYLGDLSKLNASLGDNVVDSIIALKEQLGDISDLDVLSEDLVSAINKLREDILAIPVPTFNDGTLVSDVRWSDKVDHSYIGSISDFAGFVPGPNGTTGLTSIMDCINEVRELITINLRKVVTISVDDTKLEKNFRSYPNSISYSGNFNVKLQKNGLTVISFRVTVNEVEGKNIRIDNVFIKEDLQDKAWLKNPANYTQALADYLYGFAIVFYNGNLDFSLKSNRDKDGTNIVFDRVLLEYQNMYTSANNGLTNMTVEPFDSNGSIPLMENAGSYVSNPYNKFNIPITANNRKYTLFDTKRKVDATVRLKKNQMVLASFKVRSEGQGDVKIYDASYRPFSDVSSFALDKTTSSSKPVSINDGIFYIDTYSISGHYKTEFRFTVRNNDNILDINSLNVSKALNSNLLIAEVSRTTSSVTYSVKIDPSSTAKSTTEQITVSLNGLEKTIDVDIDNRPRTNAELRTLCAINTLSLYEINTELLDDLSSAFENSTRTEPQFRGIETWDVSNVTNFSNMFKNAVNFNHDITGLAVDSKWILVNATNLSGMFEGARSFNQDISGWNTESVINVDRMFKNATSFNRNINNWRLYNLQSVNDVFTGCPYRADWSITAPTDMIEFGKYVNCKTNLALMDVRNITDMSNAFQNSNRLAVNFAGIETWDVSNVTNMSNMFRDAAYFNNDISSWDVRRVTNMSGMFKNALEYNQPLNNWDVSAVTDMSSMFEGAVVFNGALTDWNTISLINTDNMFKGCIAFNQPLNHFNMSMVTSSISMFNGCSIFNQPLNNWNTSMVTDMTEMFKDAIAFDQNINNWKIYSLVDKNTDIFLNCPTQPIWITLDLSPSDTTELMNLIENNLELNIGNIDVSAITSFSRFFSGKSSWPNDRFDGIGNWDMSNVTTIDRMFLNCTNFNQNLNNWDVSRVTNMDYAFERCGAFNGNISNWDTSSVTSMSGTFYSCSSFNQNINNWNVSHVTNMWQLFSGCTRFNQPLNNWNVSAVTDMTKMFYQCTAFNQPLDNWDVSSVNNMENMFGGCTAFNSSLNGTGWSFKSGANITNILNGCTSFNQPLNNWDVSNLSNLSNIFRGCRAFNQSLDSWDVSSISNFSYIFYGCTIFDQPLSNWDVSNGTNFTSMFESASNFNQDISSWDMSRATTTGSMFRATTRFNQPLNNWDVSNITNLSNMFDRATGFNQPLDNWDTSNVTNMFALFWGASAFRQNINGWNVLNVTNKTDAFEGCPTQPWWYTRSPRPETKENLAFIVAIQEVKLSNIDVSNITDISELFENSQRTSDQFLGLDTWNVANVTNMDRFCKNATNMNVNLDNWILNENVTMVEAFDGVALQPDWYKYNLKPTTKQELMTIVADLDVELNHIDTSLITDMSGIFENSTRTSDQFAGIETWDVSNVVNMDNMFKDAANFDKNLDDWNIVAVNSMTDAFTGCISQPWWFTLNINPTNRAELEALLTNPVVKIGLIRVDLIDDFSSLFLDSVKENSYFEGLNNWRLTNATNVSDMFKGAVNFNQPLNNWSFPSTLNSLTGMFEGTRSFNQDISNWDVSNITDLSRMFKNAIAFNQNIDNWNRGLRALTTDAFFNCPTQPIWYSIKLYKPRHVADLKALCIDTSVNLSDIDTSLITDMTRVFENSRRTNDQFAGIETWDVSNVTVFNKTFANAINFNRSLSNWATSSMEDTREMFYNCVSFNSSLDGRFDFSRVTNASGMFNFAENFNQPLSHWDTSSLEIIDNMFAQATSFSQDINNWVVNSITSKLNAFDGCPVVPSWYAFDIVTPTDKQELIVYLRDTSIPLNTIDVSLITDMSGIFENSQRTNSQFAGIETWDVSHVTDMSNMFKGAVNFNKDISKWKLTSISNITSMFEGCSALNQNFDIWNLDSTIPMDLAFEGTLTRPVWYDYGALPIVTPSNRQELIGYLDTYKGDLGRIDTSNIGDFSSIFNNASRQSWTNDDFRGIEKWNTGRGTSFQDMFRGCTNFNRDLNSWNLGNVSYMGAMFRGCTSFNKPLNSWDLNGVISLQEMFMDCTSFNQPLDRWDTSTASNMHRMFKNCTSFDQNLDGWNVSSIQGYSETFANCPTQPSWYSNLQNQVP